MTKVRKGRFLVWAVHTKKWEAAHQEAITSHTRIDWIRDDMSTICAVGEEIAVAEFPPKPINAR